METKDNRLTRYVQTQAGKTISHTFDVKYSPEHHIQDICTKSGEPFNSSWVLTWKESADRPSSVLSRTKQVQDLPEGTVLKLVNGEAMVFSKKRSLELSCSDSRAVERTYSELERLLPGVAAKENVAFYWVKEDGLKLLTTAATNNVRLTDMAMTVLVSLLQYEPVGHATSEYFKGNMGSLDKTFFSYVLQAAFDSSVRGGAASSCALCYLLDEFPSLCQTVHSAANGPAPGESQDSPPLYRKLAEALLESDGPALLALRAMYQAAPMEGSSDVYGFSGPGFAQAEILDALQDEVHYLSEDDEDFVDRLVDSFQSSSLESETLRILGGSLHDKASSNADRLRTENKELQKRLATVEADRNRRKRNEEHYRVRLLETLNFVNFEKLLPGLGRQLRAIVKYGIKQMNFVNGYGPLHYVCEKSVDPAIVTLAAMFVTDLEDFDKADDNGMRPIDYARRNPSPGVRQALQVIRTERFERAFKAMGKDLSPELNNCMEIVFKKGWNACTPWKHNFTAVHLAATQGKSAAIDMLARLKADLTVVDDKGKTALDYAKSMGKQNVVDVLESLGASKVEKPGYQTAAGYKFGEQAAGEQSAIIAGASSADSGAAPVSPAYQPPPEEKMSDQMKHILQVCEKRGYRKIEWPHNFTALHMAAQEGSALAVKNLLDISASVHLEVREDGKKQTPLEIAKQRFGKKPGYDKLFALLGAGGGEELESPRPAVKPSEPSTQTDELDHAEEDSPEKPFGAHPSTMAKMSEALKASQRFKEQLKSKRKNEGLTAEEEAKYKQELKEEMDEKVQQKLEQLGEELQDQQLKVTDEDMNIDMLGMIALKDMYVESQARRIQLQKELEELKAGGAAALAAEQEKEESGLKGPLDEESIVKFLPKVDDGKALCIKLLQTEEEAGGAGLSEKEATLAYSQLEVIKRIADKYHPEPVAAPATSKPSKGKGAPPPPPSSKGSKGSPPPAPPSKGSKGSPPPAPPSKGGKGPPPPPSKGGKGPPPPPSKGGKGPPPPPSKGGKGPPAPPSKGGKGPPPPSKGGKGPPPPSKGGKGPPPPGGKGGKGPAAPAVKSLKPAERKPVIKPGARMKSLNWKKRTFAKDLPEDTIWSKVENRTALVFSETIADVFEDCMKPELEKRFSRDAMKVEVVKKEEESKKKEDLTFFPGGMERLPYDMFAKSLDDRGLSPQKVCDAVDNMDEIVLKDIEDLKKLRELFIPDVDAKDRKKPFNSEAPQWAAMQLKREMALATDPMTKWALPEAYGWALNQMKCVADRLECWIFARETPAAVSFFQEKLDVFNACMDGVLNSKALPTYFSILLEVGNYLNGGNKRLGQADAFDFELDGMSADLAGTKDPNGQPIGSLIWKVFIDKLPDEARQCLEDLNPTLCNLRRDIMKEGAKHPKDPKMPAPPICKRPMLCIEDLENPIQALADAVGGLVNKVPTLLKVLMEPDSEFARKFEGDAGIMVQSKNRIDKLVADFEASVEKFERAKRYFNIKKPMESGDWFEEWDQLIVPHTMLICCCPGLGNKKKEEIQECWNPKFFSNNPLDLQAMQILYNLTTWNDVQLETLKKRHAAKKAAEAAANAEGGEEPKKRSERTPRKRRFGRREKKSSEKKSTQLPTRTASWKDEASPSRPGAAEYGRTILKEALGDGLEAS